MKDNLPVYLFHQGTNFKTYEYLGVHPESPNGTSGMVFRVWAPSAAAVFVEGDFNGWDRSLGKMKKLSDSGIFELFVSGAKYGDKYKYIVRSRAGEVEKADPYAFFNEDLPGHASVIYDIDNYEWHDGEYLSHRGDICTHNLPMNIYEVNLASFMRKKDGGYYSYREYAGILVDYVKKSGYNYVELMPVTEYPFDGSWGYQVTGYFAVTSRFGTPDDFKYLVDKFHEEGIGVLLDWVPAHFPKDSFGLYEFDGGPLYEAHGWDRIEHKGWGTRRFDFGRTEIQSFLVSSAEFFLDKYHIDGIRMDAVASMIYLDYDKKPGEWIPNIYGDNKNLEAIAFIKKLNKAVHEDFRGIIMIAEESTAFAGVTRPVAEGGLGFDYKWNMGWMNDALSYIATDPFFRKYDHNKLTFSMMYAYSEHYILPVSHDEVVHGKRSLLDKNFGSYGEKFAGNRAFAGYMTSHPGKKLLFMGAEYGQFKEWDFSEGLEFFLKKYPAHRQLYEFYKDLNDFYLSTPALYGDDDGWDGFEWLAADDAQSNIIAYKRKYKGEEITVIINFSGREFDYRLGIEKGVYTVVFNSDKAKYGGSGKVGKRTYRTRKISSHGKEYSIEITLPELSFVYLNKTK
ncbi:MAG: 1,4-alpha-glucan branching protein GlgB [Clostridia bacterium]|nr:1,4-alpha-glucan branching protein GlgB [Clostridia bacterium]